MYIYIAVETRIECTSHSHLPSIDRSGPLITLIINYGKPDLRKTVHTLSDNCHWGNCDGEAHTLNDDRGSDMGHSIVAIPAHARQQPRGGVICPPCQPSR